MREEYLGDSYDLVKHFWAASLMPIAPLYAYPRLIPVRLAERYSIITKIPVFDPTVTGQFGILFDPNTGIYLPHEELDRITASHISLPLLIRVFNELRPAYAICFDQAFHRTHDLGRQGQMQMKVDFLRGRGIFSFYYLSHAPFLFMAASEEMVGCIRDRLICLGIPGRRLGHLDRFTTSPRNNHASQGQEL